MDARVDPAMIKAAKMYYNMSDEEVQELTKLNSMLEEIIDLCSKGKTPKEREDNLFSCMGTILCSMIDPTRAINMFISNANSGKIQKRTTEILELANRLRAEGDVHG